MGPIKSITHSYTWNEYLFWYIQRKDIPNIEWVLENKPGIINDPLTVNYKTTPLHRAAVNGSLEICKLLIEKYKADVNHPTEIGQTPLMGAAKRDHIELVRYLLSMGADPEKVSSCGLIAVEYSLLSGFYETSLLIFERMKKKDLKHPLDYEQLGIIYNYRYVNYTVFVENLLMQVDPDNVPNFLIRPKRVYADPVVDPRETWKQWIVRQMEFKDPPLCQRSELPQQLQPQNRLFGKIRHYMSKMAMTHRTQKPSLYPVSMSEVDSRETFHHKEQMKEEKAEQSQLQMKTVS